MVHQYQRMLQRNLLYTAVTRSKELLILLGEPQAYQTCVTHESATRLTTLQERINGSEAMTPLQRQRLAQYEEADDPFTIDSPEVPAKSENKTVSTDTVSKEPPIQKQEIDLFATTSMADIVEETAEDKPSTELLAAETVPEEPISRELTIEMVQKNAIDPMIGMENLSPYDFLVS